MSDAGITLQVPVAPSVTDRADHAFAVVDRWLFSEPMAELLDAFSVDESVPADWLHLNEELPAWLLQDSIPGLSTDQTNTLRRTLTVERMAADDFNFRGDGSGGKYLERFQARTGDMDAELRKKVEVLADRLGLVNLRPPRADRYEKTLVLGGGFVSPLLRARYAAHLRAEGVDLGRLDFLGSPRLLLDDPPERQITDSYAPGARDEFDLMVGAARSEFGVRPGHIVLLCGCSSTSVPCPRWSHAGHEKAASTPPEYTHERTVDLLDESGTVMGMAISPSTSRPPYRPDTSDTFGLWSRLAQPQAYQRILVVTTQIFVPFQTFDGLRRLYLPYGLDIDTVGFFPHWSDRPQTAEVLLQETLSAIRSARRLLTEAASLLGAATRPA